MSTQPQAPLVVPDMATLLDMKVREAMSALNCHQVGTIQSFNASKQTATVSINMKLTVGGVVKDYPLLVDVPVFVLGGGDRVVTIPIQTGDTCLVLFNDRDIDNWFSSGIATTPNSTRLHDLSDGLALVGFRSAANPVSSYSTSDVEVRNGSSKIGVGSKILIKNSSYTLLEVMSAVVDALTTLNSVKTGGDASSSITLASTKINGLLKS